MLTERNFFSFLFFFLPPERERENEKKNVKTQKRRSLPKVIYIYFFFFLSDPSPRLISLANCAGGRPTLATLDSTTLLVAYIYSLTNGWGDIRTNYDGNTSVLYKGCFIGIGPCRRLSNEVVLLLLVHAFAGPFVRERLSESAFVRYMVLAKRPTADLLDGCG